MRLRSDGNDLGVSMESSTDAQFLEYRNIVRDFTAAKLIEEGLCTTENVQRTVGSYDPPHCPSMQALKVVATRVNREHKRVFQNMCERLNVSEENLYCTFLDVAKELFLGRTNWGRIVAFVAFSGAFSVHCVRAELGSRVPEVTEWTAQFMKEHLGQWITEHRGWEGFRDHFGIQPAHPLLSAGIFLTAGVVVVGGVFLLAKALAPS